MVNIIGVRFQQNGKMYYFDADLYTPALGDYVIVNTVHGHDLGEVVMGVRTMEEEQIKFPLQKTIRLATDQDIQRARENRTKETEAFSICQKKITEHGLEMKLVSVECMFDNSKILFYFTANGRVDFRALVKDLASIFKTRIELRQIGVRDEARMLGGLGPCGRPICCGSFLNDFQPVSIKMAKEQNLSLNPTKISGVCGRLMCCLKYEQDHYEQTRKKMPRVGREVLTPDGNGTVTDLNIVKETVSVKIIKGDDGEIREYPLDKIIRQNTREEAQNEASEDPELLLSDQNPLEKESDFVSEEINETLENSVFSELTEDDSQQMQKQNPEKRKSRPSKQQRNPQKSRENRQKQKNRSTEKETANLQLGQVVRRENPAKNRIEKQTQANPEIRENVAENRTERKEILSDVTSDSTPVRAKTSNWAAAVEKALQAADENDHT